MSFNSNGISEIVNSTFELFNYLAYGDGNAGDNDTSLENEIGRNLVYDQVAYTDYFTITATIGLGEGNGYDLTEFGLAVDNTGEISSTYVNFPLTKNQNYEVIIYSTIQFTGLI